MPGDERARGRRNAAVLAGTAAVVGGLFLLPTSTDSTGGHACAQQLAPVGVLATGPDPAATPAPASPSAGAATTTGPGPGPSRPPTSGATRVNGTAVDTRYGPVQVRLTLSDGRVLAATAIAYPSDSGQSRAISRYAVPILQTETVTGQSAQVDAVSGATYTSAGYQQSLQAALDAAHR